MVKRKKAPAPPAAKRSGSETRRRDRLFTLRCSELELEAWREAAQRNDFPLALWVRWTLNRNVAAILRGKTSASGAGKR